MQTLQIAVPAHVPASLIAQALAPFAAVIVPKAKRARPPREIPEPVIVRKPDGTEREIDGVTVAREIQKLMRRECVNVRHFEGYDAYWHALPIDKGTAAYVKAWEASRITLPVHKGNRNAQGTKAL